jgi:hypothetical protein
MERRKTHPKVWWERLKEKLIGRFRNRREVHENLS